MIARRGFLAGCLAVVASPLALFRRKPVDEGPSLTLDQADEFIALTTKRHDRDYLDFREKPTMWFLGRPSNPDGPMIEIRQFSRQIEVWCDGAQWAQREDGSSSWMVFEGNSQNWYGAIRLLKREDGFDVDWYAFSLPKRSVG